MLSSLKRLLHKRVPLTPVVIVSALLLGYVAFDWWQTIKHGRYAATDDQLSDFRGLLSQWPLFHGGKYPGPTPSDAIKAIENDPLYGPNFDKRAYSMLRANRDSWGRPFVYELDEGWGSGRIRSLGPNGRDENGGGDDIRC